RVLVYTTALLTRAPLETPTQVSERALTPAGALHHHEDDHPGLPRPPEHPGIRGGSDAPPCEILVRRPLQLLVELKSLARERYGESKVGVARGTLGDYETVFFGFGDARDTGPGRVAHEQEHEDSDGAGQEAPDVGKPAPTGLRDLRPYPHS